MIKRYMCINIELSLEFGNSLQFKSIISKRFSGGVHYIVCYSVQHFIVNEQRVFGANIWTQPENAREREVVDGTQR